MDRKTFYITTAIDYANGQPHIGHALEKIGADAIVRYRRQRGDSVHFLMGMDEHGQKIAQSAAAAGESPQEWTDRIADDWRAAWRLLGVSYDDFIRTTESRHADSVREIIRLMEANGDLYQATYAGFYCVGCEGYKTEADLVDGRCPEHPSREIQWLEEEDWFFRLSAYRDRLLTLLEERPEFVRPDSRRNEVRRMIEEIKDISVSRSGLAWGIRWPGDPDHAVYVWIDALTNYLSATGFPAPGFERLWPADLHVIGKDIIRFHCVYWPAMLMSAGLPVPRTVWAHGWMTMSGGKISKSEGTTIGIPEAVNRYGADAFRYFVLREVPWDSDGNFSWDRFDERYTSELANDLGNLANRTLSMIHRYRSGTVPAGGATELDGFSADVIAKFVERMDEYALHDGAASAFRLVSEANSFVERQAPWKLAKDPEAAGRLDEVLATLARTLAVISALLYPFMPEKMSELWWSLGGEGAVPTYDRVGTLDLGGRAVATGAVLFPRPELEKA